MPNFLAQIQEINTSTPPAKINRLEPRSLRRQKIRETSKPARNRGAVAPSSVTKFTHAKTIGRQKKAG